MTTERDAEIDDITALPAHADARRARYLADRKRQLVAADRRAQRDREHQRRRLDRIESAVQTALDNNGLSDGARLRRVLVEIIDSLFPDESFNR